ncbi:MAG: three-Cys-motif partner protein TcmP [Caldilineaceae bacterium]|nr:three-Cys-motif partner protein TcmP [Caldilineaceae bacterium]
MTDRSFGGPWTQEKLRILSLYLDAYTTALKDRPFRLIYVDAFAGEGAWLPSLGYSNDYDDFRELHKGSARIALETQDKRFDRLIFIEKDPERCRSLEMLRSEFPHRDISILNDDAEIALPAFCDQMLGLDRAVVFLDPFATEVSWTLVEGLAQTQKVDCWILFPLGAISRMMPNSSEPSRPLAVQLDRVFGGREHWQDIYSPSPQLSLFGDDPGQERESGSEQIANLYRERLKSVFEKVAPSGRALKNSKKSPMFQLFFAASNPVGAPLAVRIASYIIGKW